MIIRLDSAYPPSPDTARAAAAGGVRGWDGYISTAPYDGASHFWLWHPWPQEGFEYARLCGSPPIAYCSGWDDPVALKGLAASWGVRLCLDVESGIRGDGPWVQGFLDASGAGLYGNYWVHRGRTAPFHVICASLGLGDPQSTWWDARVVRPPVPCGYQWWNTHTEFGVSVDRGNFDDWFAGLFSAGGTSLSASSAPMEATTIVATKDAINLFGRGTDNALWHLRWASDTGWGPWTSLGGKLTAPDIAVTQRGDQIDVFVIGEGGGTFHIYTSDQGVTWSGYEAHGGQLTSSLVAIASEPDRLDDQILAAIRALPAGADFGPVLQAANDAKAASLAAKAAAEGIKFPTTLSGKLA